MLRRERQSEKVRAFVNHLRARGYDRDIILPLVRAAVSKARQIARGEAEAPQPAPDPGERRTFLHLPYHPDSPSSRLVQRAWKARVSQSKFGRLSKEILNRCNYPINIERLTVAYHQSHNLGNLLSYPNLSKRNGSAVSSLI